MQLKRVLALLLVLVMCFVLPACVPNTNDQSTPPTTPTPTPAPTPAPSSTITPLLYRVTNDSGNTVWLFGSIHVGREDFYPLPDYVLDAFEGADALAVEADIVAFEKDFQQQVRALSRLVYYDGTTIKDHIPQEQYDKAVAILKEYNSYVAALDSYYPALWGSMIDSLMITDLGGDPNLGIDRYLIDRAYQTQKEILEVESAEFQYALLGDFDEDIQLMILESALESYGNKEEAAAELDEMMTLWASGDEEVFIQFLNASDEEIPEEEKQAMERYNQVMLTDRNLDMGVYASNALASGKEVFICVGAAHVIGEGSLTELLAQSGCTVERITE